MNSGSMSNNECPTFDNKIDCSVCTLECKLRMQLDIDTKADLPESALATIYY